MKLAPRHGVHVHYMTLAVVGGGRYNVITVAVCTFLMFLYQIEKKEEASPRAMMVTGFKTSVFLSLFSTQKESLFHQRDSGKWKDNNVGMLFNLVIASL